jgi:hypothetical protein
VPGDHQGSFSLEKWILPACQANLSRDSFQVLRPRCLALVKSGGSGARRIHIDGERVDRVAQLNGALRRYKIFVQELVEVAVAASEIQHLTFV